MKYSVGVDIGGTLIKTVACDEKGAVLYRDIFETRDMKEPEENGAKVSYWIDSVKGQIEGIAKELKADASCIGIAAPGIVDENRPQTAALPGKLKGIEGLEWEGALGGRYPVAMLNDAHAALLGESWVGCAKGMRNAAMVTLGTGVGGALMLDGTLVRGTIGRAGHIGHICIDPFGMKSICNAPGGLEWFVGDYSVSARTGGRYDSTRKLVEDYKSGKSFATSVWLYSVRALACGIVSVINLVDPEVVVLGGGITEAGDALFEPLAEMLEEFEWRPGGHTVRILRACLGEHGGAIGAARYAFDSLCGKK